MHFLCTAVLTLHTLRCACFRHVHLRTVSAAALMLNRCWFNFSYQCPAKPPDLLYTSAFPIRRVYTLHCEAAYLKCLVALMLEKKPTRDSTRFFNCQNIQECKNTCCLTEQPTDKKTKIFSVLSTLTTFGQRAEIAFTKEISRRRVVIMRYRSISLM